MAARRGRWQRDLAKERQWRRIMRRWRNSGLSVREFCDWQGLSEASFYAWRRELALRDGEAATAASSSNATVGERRPQNGSSQTLVPGFVPVRVVVDGEPADAVSPSRSDGIEVHFPDGVRLAVHPECDRALLRDVIACCRGLTPEARPC